MLVCNDYYTICHDIHYRVFLCICISILTYTAIYYNIGMKVLTLSLTLLGLPASDLTSDSASPLVASLQGKLSLLVCV